ncbi:hypothetical protein M422DRAFT_250172 [Sphaerobolus stellatus SS14]|uniref:Unplaced genomic scaffold SPHSTscaffold_33, whole genome shotgun sequence n=1 Tax=Sphaerobolus stellatus (strain SS14) TaxID=990650 RepID=A0A0C9W333_SPHS4|nr:hypothetical protein M422DRAFT_250172 [Sphaerobolus stellatus SS14]
MSSSTQRSNHPSIRVICLGLGRTVTISLAEALEILGYGPCYHTSRWVHSRPSDFHRWIEQYEKGGDPELIDNILQDAKFILTTRDPEKWERSMKLTINAAVKQVLAAVEPEEWQKSVAAWNELRTKLQPELLTDNFKDAIVRHNKHVEDLIPASQLLVYKVEDGWEPLIEFLGVPIPDVPFPNVNNTDMFRAMVKLPPLQ